MTNIDQIWEMSWYTENGIIIIIYNNIDSKRLYVYWVYDSLWLYHELVHEISAQILDSLLANVSFRETPAPPHRDKSVPGPGCDESQGCCAYDLSSVFGRKQN